MNKNTISYNKYGWFFTGAAIVLFSIFILLPILMSIILSMFSTANGSVEFVWIDNLKRAFNDPLFWTAMRNTFRFFIIQIPIMLTMAIILASILNSDKIKGKWFFRTAIFLPVVTSLVAYSVLFKLMFATDGIVNNILMDLGILAEAYNWLSDPFWANVIIILALLWRWTGYNMIFYLAAMQNIPKDSYEAADMDGAGMFKKFRYVTLPALRPVILFTLVMSTIGTLQLFDEPMNITGGGPADSTITISQYIYEISFVYQPDFGYAVTLSYIIVSIIALITIVQFKVVGDDYE